MNLTTWKTEWHKSSKRKEFFFFNFILIIGVGFNYQVTANIELSNHSIIRLSFHFIVQDLSIANCRRLFHSCFSGYYILTESISVFTWFVLTSPFIMRAIFTDERISGKISLYIAFSFVHLRVHPTANTSFAKTFLWFPSGAKP